MKPKITFIRCAKCYKIGEIINDKIPNNCPNCGNVFNKYQGRQGVLNTILNILSGGSEKGFFECNEHGWVRGDGWVFPHEKTLFW